ncbi:hypothetical protein IPM09_03370 [Candidatus Saccharibacteria bacterium]|nr:MAG: hypothetical protein IPM09_03370 [Candidatus Saccharibacteria bacterium]
MNYSKIKKYKRKTMFERFKKPKSIVELQPERQVSPFDPRIFLYTPQERALGTNHVAVKRNRTNVIESGWAVVGESEDGLLREVRKSSGVDEYGQPQELIKTVSLEDIQEAEHKLEDSYRQQAAAMEAEREAHRVEQERLARERAAFGERAARLVEYDEDGMIIVPSWMERPQVARSTPAPVVSPKLQHRAQQAAAEVVTPNGDVQKADEQQERRATKSKLAGLVDMLDRKNYSTDPVFRASRGAGELKEMVDSRVGLRGEESGALLRLSQELFSLQMDTHMGRLVTTEDLHAISTKLAKLLATMTD